MITIFFLKKTPDNVMDIKDGNGRSCNKINQQQTCQLVFKVYCIHLKFKLLKIKNQNCRENETKAC